MPNLILAGPPGTGKTTSILAMARQLLGSHFKDAVLELNASDDRWGSAAGHRGAGWHGVQGGSPCSSWGLAKQQAMGHRPVHAAVTIVSIPCHGVNISLLVQHSLMRRRCSLGKPSQPPQQREGGNATASVPAASGSSKKSDSQQPASALQATLTHQPALHCAAVRGIDVVRVAAQLQLLQPPPPASL
jgi:hypothetical protein